jgi:hypothetical protein
MTLDELRARAQRLSQDPELRKWLRTMRWRQTFHIPCDDCDRIKVLGGLTRCHVCGFRFCAKCWLRHQQWRYGRDPEDRCGDFIEAFAQMTAAMRTNVVLAVPEDEDYALARQALREAIRADS